MKVKFLRALSKASYFTEILHLKIFKLFEILCYIVTPFFHIFLWAPMLLLSLVATHEIALSRRGET